MVKTVKWSENQVNALVEGYDPDNSDVSVAALMEKLGKTKRQVIGKLVSQKVYKAPIKEPKPKKDDGPTKGEILTAIVAMGFDVKGFEPATKDALNRLLVLVSK